MRLVVSLFMAIILSVLLSVVGDWLFLFHAWSHYTGVPLFTITSTVVYFIVLKQPSAAATAQAIMVCITIKLLLAMIISVIASFVMRDAFRVFSIHFIVQYVVFTIFEVILLTSHLKTKRLT
jgi:hypothetical protein